MITVEHIHKSFGNYCALNDVSLNVPKGSIFGLLGPNGAGKSTLIRIINRIIAADSGKIYFDGQPLTDKFTSQIGYLPEERGLYKKMKVGEQALYLAQLKGLSKTDAIQRLHEWFARFEIEDWWNRRVEELSKGMQQKVQFIVTVLHNPKLLIFDEPFSGFDPVNATLLKNEIIRLRDLGATVILSTHNMASVEEICDDIALINRSQVVLSGGVREIRESYRQNKFHVECTGLVTVAPNVPRGFVITNLILAKGNRPTSFDIKLPSDATTSDLLQIMLPQCTLVSLNELLPSMNDIFIHSVKSSAAL